MSKLSKLAALVAVVPVLAFSSPVFADSPGQLSNGPTNYKVRNVTQNTDYSQSTNAACGETVKYSVTLANSDFGMLTDLTLKANLASGAISASAKNVNGDTTSVSGSVTVNTPGTLQYVNGTTVRLTGDAAQTPTALPDGVAGDGVNVGNLNGSTYIRVQFQAKVNCETPNQIKVCDLTTKKIVTINESDFNSAKHTKDLTKCQAAPAVLVNTGAGSAMGIAAAIAAVSAVAYSFVTGRRLTRQ
jgi:hypothetical protein